HADTYAPAHYGPQSWSSGVLITNDHFGTHIDAPCHQAHHMQLLGGVPVAPEVETQTGFTQLGAETIPPLVGRGALLDVAAHLKRDPLLDEYPITRKDLSGCAEAQGVALSPGDVALVRTGAGKLWNDPARYAQAGGLAPDASRWLGEKDVRAVGADNLFVDAVGVRDEATGAMAFAHLHLLSERGIYLVENLNLEALAADRLYHFVFVGLPLKLKGATGSPIRPIAIRAG
ncbi:MAG: cyclase family protein, partial [Chloroflexi bacterium]|nr:cyclase family protein [Chloroflexota bacterium]